MDSKIFCYNLSCDTTFFTDTLKTGKPYISKKPRDHESLFFVTKGGLLYEKQGKKEVVSKGQVGYISRGSVDISSPYLCDEVSYIAVSFCFDRQNPLPQKTLPFDTVYSQGVAYNYEKQFEQALNCFVSKSPGYITICNGMLLQIIGQLYNEHETGHDKFSKITKIENSIQYIKSNYSNPELKISKLALVANMSEKHFRRIFSEIYKKTPYAFLQEFRIDKAEILLLNTSKSISDIALQCGFSDVYSFSHCFKKHRKMSPRDYRTKV